MEALKIRNQLKSKKPTFIRHDAHKKKRISKVWRRPKGIQNKMRLTRRGYSRARSSGFGSPKIAHGLSRDGLKQVVVANVDSFKQLDPKVDGIIVARTVGNRRRLELVDYAVKNKFTILNIDVDKFKESVKTSLASKASKKAEFEKKKESQKKVAQEKSKKKDVKDDESQSKVETTDEEKKLAQKKEHDKILTKGD